MAKQQQFYIINNYKNLLSTTKIFPPNACCYDDEAPLLFSCCYLMTSPLSFLFLFFFPCRCAAFTPLRGGEILTRCARYLAFSVL